ncbi:MAG: hypothetical protein H6850_03475 [Alphaproteobacteria bacterium]|nr:MAG: hypothetical protein H6850_03475 [Alphaproteobacteria bacterium]
MKQGAFDLSFPKDYSDKNFYVDSYNEDAYRWIKIWPQKKFDHIHFACIHGPKSCGKSHLMHIWKHYCKATIIEKIGQSPYDLVEKNKFFILPHIDEIKDHRWLFYLYNVFLQHKCYLLTTAYKSPNLWKAETEDLKSRFKMFYPVEIKRPEHLDVLLRKMLKSRGLAMSDFQIQYTLRRIERSFNSLYEFAAKVDEIQQTTGQLKFKDVVNLCS